MASPRRGASALLLVALGAGFAWGAAWLLERRLAGGDVYPAFSSLKADPDGARALYEAFQELRGSGVRRNFDPIGRLAAGPGTAVLLLGTEPWSLEHAGRHEAERLEAAVRSGARLVIALTAQGSSWRSAEPTATPTPGKAAEKKGAARDGRKRSSPAGRDESGEEGDVSLSKRWGFELESGEPFETPPLARLAARQEASGLPRGVPWHSETSFAKLDPAWRAVYRLGSKPVLIERTLSRGSIVLATDSTFASNATLKSGRQPALLAWLAGDRPEIVFDETHLGMSQREGIAALARRYRLEGLFFGLLLLALLFVWKNAVAFAPAAFPSAGESVAVAGRRASEGLAAVLRRHIAPRDLPRICFDEWRRAFARSRPEKVRALSRTALEQDPVAAYRRAAALTKEKGLT